MADRPYRPRLFNRPGRVAHVLVRSGAALWCYVEGLIATAKERGVHDPRTAEVDAQTVG
jgi:hypothetical protein